MARLLPDGPTLSADSAAGLHEVILQDYSNRRHAAHPGNSAAMGEGEQALRQLRVDGVI